MMYQLKCDWCGKKYERGKISRHNFCCRQCLADFSNKSKNPEGYATLKDYGNMSRHMTVLNQKANPSRMTPETRAKIRNARMGTGDGKTYTKRYGRHEHRVVAEQKLGRTLLPGEIVHHEDGNKNNDPRNIHVFASQSEHASYHMKLRQFFRDLDVIEKEEGGEAL